MEDTQLSGDLHGYRTRAGSRALSLSLSPCLSFCSPLPLFLPFSLFFLFFSCLLDFVYPSYSSYSSSSILLVCATQNCFSSSSCLSYQYLTGTFLCRLAPAGSPSTPRDAGASREHQPKENRKPRAAKPQRASDGRGLVPKYEMWKARPCAMTNTIQIQIYMYVFMQCKTLPRDVSLPSISEEPSTCLQAVMLSGKW